jgi:hypothetical protein
MKQDFYTFNIVRGEIYTAVYDNRYYRRDRPYIPPCIDFIRGEGLIPRGSAAVIKVLNPRPIPYKNNIPRGSAARLLIFLMRVV